MFTEIKDQLDRIEDQTTKHNGRLTRMERALLIVGTAVGVVLIVNGNSLIGFISSIL